MSRGLRGELSVLVLVLVLVLLVRGELLVQFINVHFAKRVAHQPHFEQLCTFVFYHYTLSSLHSLVLQCRSKWPTLHCTKIHGNVLYGYNILNIE